jgi:phage shock protein PspC (stress-responsive transcriptional regulator)
MEPNEQVSTSPPGGDAPAPPAYRRLTRRPEGKVIAGVASGLGEYFVVDPVIFRVAFVVLAVFGGVGIILYGLAWWIIPEADSPPRMAGMARVPLGDRLYRRVHELPAWLGIALVILGAAALVGRLRFGAGPLFWGVALIGLGVLVFRRGEQEGTATPPPPVAPIAPAAPVETTTAVVPPVVAPPATRVPKRRRSALGWFTLGAILLALGIGAALHQAGAITVSASQFVALAMTVLGMGLLVGAWLGRAYLLIILGLFLVPVLLVASLVRVPITGGTGDHFVRPATVTQLQPAYHLAAGRLVLDLRDLDPALADVPLTVTNAAGQIDVILPTGMGAQVHASAGAGEVDLLGRIDNGVNVSMDRTFVADPGAATMILDLRVGLGRVHLLQELPDGSLR